MLMHEVGGLIALVSWGVVCGGVVGYLWGGRRGCLIGGAVAAVFGLLSPWLYLPFWLYFTLPPHPKVDL
jgi:hypothetical protein